MLFTINFSDFCDYYITMCGLAVGSDQDVCRLLYCMRARRITPSVGLLRALARGRFVLHHSAAYVAGTRTVRP